MTKLPDDVVHAAVEGYFGYKMPPSEERNQTMRRALDAASLNIVAHVERLEENLVTLRAENEKLRAALKPFAAAAITYEPCGFRIEWDIIPIDIDAARKALGETDD